MSTSVAAGHEVQATGVSTRLGRPQCMKCQGVRTPDPARSTCAQPLRYPRAPHTLLGQSPTVYPTRRAQARSAMAWEKTLPSGQPTTPGERGQAPRMKSVANVIDQVLTRVSRPRAAGPGHGVKEELCAREPVDPAILSLVSTCGQASMKIRSSFAVLRPDSAFSTKIKK